MDCTTFIVRISRIREKLEKSLRSQMVQQPELDAVQLLLQLRANPELATQLNANVF